MSPRCIVRFQSRRAVDFGVGHREERHKDEAPRLGIGRIRRHELLGDGQRVAISNQRLLPVPRRLSSSASSQITFPDKEVIIVERA